MGGAIERLGRVVERERGHRGGGQRLHLDARAVDRPDGRFDAESPSGLVGLDEHVDPGHADGWQWAAAPASASPR